LYIADRYKMMCTNNVGILNVSIFLAKCTLMYSQFTKIVHIEGCMLQKVLGGNMWG